MKRAALAALAVCAALLPVPALASHMTAHGPPTGPAPRDFAQDFSPPHDSEWAFHIGGFGGVSRGAPLRNNPVIFVHGNSEDASFWDSSELTSLRVHVRQRMRDAGYSDQEIWALSYNGARCGNTLTCGTANDVNTVDFYVFVFAVQGYTRSMKVDVIAHSLGVTVVRKAIKQYPELLSQIEDLVLIAGANHGTTSCRGFETIWFGCNEIVPGSPWLADLNAFDPLGEGDETPGPINYMTLYDGSGTADNFFLKTAAFDDSQSPALTGARNVQLPGTAHSPLGRGEQAFNLYLAFIKEHNEVRQFSGGPVDMVFFGRPTRRPLAATGQPWWLPIIATVLLAAGFRIFRSAGRNPS